MHKNLKLCLKLVLLSLSLLLISCTSPLPTVKPVTEHYIPVPQSIINTDENHYWWYASFKLAWDGQAETLDLSKDLIIAHQLINPVLRDMNKNIKLWRFHRRAANDNAGHQFSFIFYADPQTAAQIFMHINHNPLTRQLIEEKIIAKVKLDNPEIPKRSKIEDTSDKSWSKNLQRSWPYYIMGVSVMWLDLLNREIDADKLAALASVTARMKYYHSVNANLTMLWKTQGEHAFYHHINAIFGYEPMEIRF